VEIRIYERFAASVEERKVKVVDGRRNKMKTMVAVAVIAVLACALFLVLHTSAGVTIDSDVVPSSGAFDSKFTYIANLTSPTDATGNVILTIGSDYNDTSINKSYELMVMESPCKTKDGNSIFIKSGETCTVTRDVYFTDPALMQGDFKNWTKEAKPCEWKIAWYQINFTGWPGGDKKYKYEQGSPILTFPEPKIKFICPERVAWCEDFYVTIYVEDEMRGSGRFWIDNLFKASIYFPPEGYEYPYNGRPFNESMVGKDIPVGFNYSNRCHDKNISQKVHIDPIPCPKITVDLDGDPLFETTENRENIRYVEKNDSELPFKAIINDYVGSANVTLTLAINNDSSECYTHSWNETLTGTIGDEITKTYVCDIPFKKEEKNFTFFLNYSNEMPIENCSYNLTYNLTIIPLDIEFKNVTVSPEGGNWSEKFDYTVWVNASKDLTIALYIFDPCLESWPWIHVADRTYNKYGWKALNWTINGDNRFSKNCSGQSKFYFKYESKETKVYPGPELIGPLNINFSSPQVKPGGGCICLDSNVLNYFKMDFNYSVNVTANDKTTIRLIVADPNKTEYKLEPKDYDTPGEPKHLFWSVNIAELNQSLGTWEYKFNYTYYDNQRKITETWNRKNVKGPEIYAALRDFSLDPEYIVSSGEIPEGVTFNVSCKVNGTQVLNMTLLLIADDREEELGHYIYSSPGKEDTAVWTNIDISKYRVEEFWLGLKCK
jgi:hypothetical protein